MDRSTIHLSCKNMTAPVFKQVGFYLLRSARVCILHLCWKCVVCIDRGNLALYQRPGKSQPVWLGDHSHATCRTWNALVESQHSINWANRTAWLSLWSDLELSESSVFYVYCNVNARPEWRHSYCWGQGDVSLTTVLACASVRKHRNNPALWTTKSTVIIFGVCLRPNALKWPQRWPYCDLDLQPDHTGVVNVF